MTHWLRPPELDRDPRREPFDPALEGTRHGLSRDLALALWQRVCAEATDPSGRRDDDLARRQFHQLAARLAARGDRLRPDPGRVTRVGVEFDGASAPADTLALRVPGRTTLVAADARRRAQFGARAIHDADTKHPAGRGDLPGADDVRRALVALQSANNIDNAEALAISEPGSATAAQRDLRDTQLPLTARGSEAGIARLFGRGSSAARPTDAGVADRFGRGSTGAPTIDELSALRRATSTPGPVAAHARSTVPPSARLAARGRDGQSREASRDLLERVLAILGAGDHGAPLPGELAARMTAALAGAGPAIAFDHVRVHTDETAAEAAELIGAQAFTVGHHIYFARDQFAPGTEAGDRLLRHELTHVAQHARGELAAHGALDLVADSSAAEAEARAAEARPARPSATPQLGNDAAVRRGTDTASIDLLGGRSPARYPIAADPGTVGSAAPAVRVATATTTTSAPIARAPAANAAAGGSKNTLPVIDLLGKSTFEPPAAVAAAIDKAGPDGADIRVKFGKIASTAIIRVKKADGVYVTDEATPQIVPMSHPLFVPAKGVSPVLRVRIGASAPGAITGYVTLAGAPGDPQALQQALAQNAALVGLRGFSMPTLSITNSLEAGTLTVDSGKAIPFSLGGWVNGEVQFGLANSNITFDAHASIRAKGLEDGELTLSRDARGIKGSVALGVKLSDKFSGKATATYDKGDIVVKGELHYHSEKLNGTLGIIIADAEEAEQMVRNQIGPGNLANASAGKPGAPGKGGPRAIAGWGDLDFAFTDWLTGKAKVVYGPTGHITVIGKIAPPKQIELMKAKGVTQPIIPQANIEAKYGIPYLADVHVGIGVGLSATAGVGPIYMNDLAIEGVYSTDPAVLNRFSITGALHAQADAGLELRVRGYAGLTLAAHSVNIGAEVIGKAGLRAYAEARPTLGYRETAAPGAGKKGEYYLKGHLEMAAQPVLSLAGRLFVQLDAPRFSPIEDRTWEWPIGSLEYPIPAQMGIGADVDYVIGSGKFPEVKFSKPDFDPGKFVDTMMANRLPAKSGRDKQEKQGNFSSIAPTGPTKTPPPVTKKPVPEAKLSASPTKQAKGMQTEKEQKNVPASKQVSDKWLAGIQALGELRKRAETNPDDSNEIKAHLAAIKAAHGFTQLTAKRQGDLWVVHVAMATMTTDVNVKAEKEGGAKDAKPGADGKTGKDGKDGKKGADAKKPGDSKQEIGARITFTAHGETHAQYIDASAGAPIPMVASTPSAVKAKIAEWQPRLRELPDADQKRAGQLIGQAIAIESKIAELAQKVKAGTADNTALEAKQRELVTPLTGLFEVMPTNPKDSAPPRAYKGATKVPDKKQITGTFNPTRVVNGTNWDWSGYPAGSVTAHPANNVLGYAEHTALDQLKPAEETSYTTVFGTDTPGGSHAEEWRDHVKAKIKKKQTEDPTLNDESARKKVQAEYFASYPGLGGSEDVLMLTKQSQWQAHHIHEHSWGGLSPRKNFQYLPRTGQHQPLTNWWNSRARDMKAELLR